MLLASFIVASYILTKTLGQMGAKRSMAIHFRLSNADNHPHQTASRGYSALLATLGFILSPLSWWNDMLINVPLAYVMALPFSFLHEALFLPMFILAYWFTNVLGFVLMHYGVTGFSKKPKKLTLVKHLLITLLYTLIIFLLVYLDWIPMPDELLQIVTS